jgi:GTP cyclohydrolase II
MFIGLTTIFAPSCKIAAYSFSEALTRAFSSLFFRGHVEPKLKDLVRTPIPTPFGEFILHYYGNAIDGKEHIALVKGDVENKAEVPVRIHSECFTGDVLGSRRCDCGEQLKMAMKMIGQADYGVLLYLRQEGRGIGLLKKLQAYNLQDQGMDTVDANIHLGHLADEREYGIAALMLTSLGVKSVKLITNNPKKIDELKKLGVDVMSRIPIEAAAHEDNLDYLKTKAKKMAHFLFEHKKDKD